jgi:hypothetical protein
LGFGLSSVESDPSSIDKEKLLASGEKIFDFTHDLRRVFWSG